MTAEHATIRVVSAEIQHHLIIELTIEIGDAGNALHQIAPSIATCVEQIEDVADQTAVAIVRQGCHKLRAPRGKGDPGVAPLMLPETGTGD